LSSSRRAKEEAQDESRGNGPRQKAGEQFKASQEQMARLLAARASEQNLQRKTPALKPHTIAAPKR
jgi:hypothetical protein